MITEIDATATAKAKLRALRVEYSDLKRQFDALVAEVRQLELAAVAADREVAEANMRIHEHNALLEDESFLLELDEDQWNSIHARLIAERDRLSALAIEAQRRTAAPRMKAIEAGAALQRLHYEARNLQTLAEGRKPGAEWKGSIHAV